MNQQVSSKKKVYWGSLTEKALLENNSFEQKLDIDIIIAITKIKVAFAIADDNLPKAIKVAVIASAEEIIRQRHNKQFPLSIYSSNINEKINNNINEVIAYLVNRKVNKEINIDILNFNSSALQLVNSGINIILVNNIEEYLFKGLTKLSSYFWEIKRKTSESQGFSRRINLNINVQSTKTAQKMDSYNKQLGINKKKIYQNVIELMSLTFDINYLNNKMLDILNKELKLNFVFENANKIFDNLVFLEVYSKIKILSIMISRILKCEFKDIYKKYNQLHLVHMKYNLETLNDLIGVNNLIIFNIINNNILSLAKIIDLCKI